VLGAAQETQITSLTILEEWSFCRPQDHDALDAPACRDIGLIKDLRLPYAFLRAVRLVFLLMGSTVLGVVLAVLCVLASIFLIYIFVQFWRETTRLKRRLEQKIKESKPQTNAR
jgi:hypothetical protein